MKKLLLALTVFCSFTTWAQTYEIGHTTITFNDPARTGGFGSGGGPGRQIQSEVYYPADVAGTDVAAAMGEHPVIVFGHGFVMAWDAYANIWEELVPQGYIMVFPRTEGNFSPSHDDFGMDLALLVTKIQELNTTGGSILENHVAAKSAIMGHSMGGGSSFLAAASNTSIETVIGLAPAETNSSAISAAAQVTVPALVFSGSGDAVTPATDHHLPIYNATASSCKNYVDITGGAHCYYANSNFNCDFGEGTSGGNITITRSEQHQILFDIVTPWLDYKLKGDCSANVVFNDLLANDPRIVATQNCTFTPFVTTVSSNGVTLTADNTTASYQWLDCNNNFSPLPGETNISLTPSPGNYAVELTENGCIDTSSCFVIGTNNIHQLENEVRVYPNPSHGSLNIDVSSPMRLTLIDLKGSAVFDKKLLVGNHVLDDLEQGVYLYVLADETGSMTEKLIVL
ncbi:MAG: T9SS type A sorting domain-containing protein [Crocinitomicaceae bacterium]